MWVIIRFRIKDESINTDRVRVRQVSQINARLGRLGPCRDRMVEYVMRWMSVRLLVHATYMEVVLVQGF